MFVIPMVGLSSRFYRQGYLAPKYQLPLNDQTVFYYVINSFKKYFKTDTFLFVCRKDNNAELFVQAQLQQLGLKNFTIVIVDSNTRGQAETVYLGTKNVPIDEELYIFNIDTLRPNFSKAKFNTEYHGYLEVFKGEGDNWSFVLLDEKGNVSLTAEKKRISEYCSDGLYYFKKKQYFDSAFESDLKEKNTVNGEYYVAPLYNRLISESKIIKYHLLKEDELIFCGVPEEYECLVNSAKSKLNGLK
jgi:dTDP-glucose pyrophosphorylase